MAHFLDKKSDPKNPNVRSASMRKQGKDGATLTPTEQRKKNQLMKQFMRTGRKGSEVANASSQAYRDGWDICFGKDEGEE